MGENEAERKNEKKGRKPLMVTATGRMKIP